MKKLLFIFAVVLMFVFSCVPAFAEGQVIDGYAVSNVPYNEAFEGVLTSSSSGSQLYSSSENRTYNTSSVMSAPSTSSDSLYYFKSVTNFIPWNIWRGSNNPTITFPSDSKGYTAVKYVWASSNVDRTFYHHNEAPSFVNLKWGRKYRISFTVSFSVANGSFRFYLADRNSPDTSLITLFEASSGNLQNRGKSVSIDFTCPEGIANITPIIKGSLGGSSTELTFYVNDLTITDITTEDLDNSINKGVDKINSAIDPSVPYNSFDNGSFKDSANELKNAENALPTVDFGAIDELASSIDVSSYSQAFASINQLFVRVVDTIGITPLIFFACFFGFCIFLIGRKLSGG